MVCSNLASLAPLPRALGIRAPGPSPAPPSPCSTATCTHMPLRSLLMGSDPHTPCQCCVLLVTGMLTAFSHMLPQPGLPQSSSAVSGSCSERHHPLLVHSHLSCQWILCSVHRIPLLLTPSPWPDLSTGKNCCHLHSMAVAASYLPLSAALTQHLLIGCLPPSGAFYFIRGKAKSKTKQRGREKRKH